MKLSSGGNLILMGASKVDNISCPICKSTNIAAVLTRKNIPVYQNLLINSSEDAKQIPKGDLEIVRCIDCGFVYNCIFDANKVIYNSAYENTQSYSSYFDDYLNDLVNTLVTKKGVCNTKIVEIGCGKGFFLKKLVEAGDNYGYGFDPSYIGPEVDLNGRLRFEKRLYDEESVHINADAILCRHVIEHIPNPLILLKSLRKTLVHSPNARVFFETPCVDWIFNNKIMFDFFYEHCSYFNKHSISKAFELAGFDVLSIEHIFNGQYMWIEARPVEGARNTQNTNYSECSDTSSIDFTQNEVEWKRRALEQFSEYSKLGKTAVWGAGAKGVTLLNLIDPDLKFIDCVIDVNPNKVGNYLPGTGHEIVGIESLSNKGLSTIIVTNSNYLDEIIKVVKQKELKIKLVDIENWYTQQV
ncbi:methyltransferase domain-containing protein [Paenibacillus peoriae]|uniref:Methyltransferase domain-containing protein n=1 Tax=Paenibacillus peoriae TaxID=59893 RepID=A0A7H0Y7P3_9BACL|nr:class I SAM-dependent methyltransferase [Paenibacillus peoriae]QNR67101.1 methyltransferase domain-containing protein [Paenibacillus peoriae]